MNTFWVYILKCADDSYYVGHTDNIEKRIAEHRCKKYSGYTSKRLPVKLVYSCSFNTRNQAFEAEQKIKGWSRRKKEALITKDWNLLKKLAKKNFK